MPDARDPDWLTAMRSDLIFMIKGELIDGPLAASGYSGSSIFIKIAALVFSKNSLAAAKTVSLFSVIPWHETTPARPALFRDALKKLDT